MRSFAVALFLLLLCPAAVASAAPMRVIEVASSDSPVAAASSLRVLGSADEGLRTNGRIFGLDPASGRYSCSGTALSTPSASIVLTAGHCVLEDGRFGRRLTFVPAYDHGVRPFGTFQVETAYLTERWARSENPDFDVAGLRVRANRFGRLTDVVGSRGWVAGRSRRGSFQIFGYPAAALAGEELRSCTAKGLGSDPLTFSLVGPPTLPGACDMAGGASGGSWIVDGDLVNGVTSYGYPGEPGKLFSPYFGAEIGEFLARLP